MFVARDFLCAPCLWRESASSNDFRTETQLFFAFLLTNFVSVTRRVSHSSHRHSKCIRIFQYIKFSFFAPPFENHFGPHRLIAFDFASKCIGRNAVCDGNATHSGAHIVYANFDVNWHIRTLFTFLSSMEWHSLLVSDMAVAIDIRTLVQSHQTSIGVQGKKLNSVDKPTHEPSAIERSTKLNSSFVVFFSHFSICPREWKLSLMLDSGKWFGMTGNIHWFRVP